MTVKKLLSILLTLCICLCLEGCSNVGDLVSGAPVGEFPVEINGVTINAKPQKVAVLSPSLADVVLAMDGETQLCAGAESCTQEALGQLQKVDAGNAAAITELAPDLVLLDPNCAGVEQALRDAGLTVLNIAPAVDREDYERLYAQVSSALNGGGPGYDQGIECAQDIFQVLDEINRMIPKKDTITTGCYLYDLNGSAVTGDMLGSTIMTYSGVTNIFGSLSGGQYGEDDLRVSDPSIIFCPPGLKDELKNDSRYNNLQAVREGNIIEMEPSVMEWQGRTVVTAAMAISGGAYPELLKESSIGENNDPASKIDDNVSSALASADPEGAADEYEQLNPDDQSEEVFRMQERLEELGYLDAEYDGYYGEHTTECVKEFQRVNGLEQTGVADTDTLKRMFSTLAKDKDGNMAAAANAPTAGPNGGSSDSGNSSSDSSTSSDSGDSSNSSESSGDNG